MNYRIKNDDVTRGRVTLVRTRALQRILTVILFVTGIPFLCAGLLLFFADDIRPDSPFLLAGIGLMMVTGGFMVATKLKIPENLIFDNMDGRFKIAEKKGGDEFTAFPYADIAGFHVRQHRSDNAVSYAVEMEKKDGAFWTLFSSMKEKKAADFRDNLAKRVTLGAAGTVADDPAIEDVFTVRDQGDASAVSWKKRYPFSSYLLGALSVTSVGLIVFSIGMTGEKSAGFYIAAGFFIVLAAFFLFTIVTGAGREYIVEISRDLFRFRTRGGILKGRGFSMKTEEIAAILFNFSTSEMENTLYVLRREEMDLMQRIKRGAVGLGDIAGAFSLMIKVKKLDAGSLFIKDKISLENILQREMARRSGRTGL